MRSFTIDSAASMMDMHRSVSVKKYLENQMPDRRKDLFLPELAETGLVLCIIVVKHTAVDRWHIGVGKCMLRIGIRDHCLVDITHRI